MLQILVDVLNVKKGWQNSNGFIQKIMVLGQLPHSFLETRLKKLSVQSFKDPKTDVKRKKKD